MALGLRPEGEFDPQNPFALGGGAPQPDMGGQMAEPLPGLMVDAPKTPEETAMRRSAWATLFDKIKTDPGLQMMLMKFGTQLMQPVPAQQSSIGHLGSAMQSSVDYLQAYKDTETRRKLLEQQTKLEGARTKTEEQRPGQIAAETAGRKAETTAVETLTPARKAKIDAEIAELEKSGKLKGDTAAYYRVRAKNYPQEVEAELARARASEKAAGRNPELERLRVVAGAAVAAGEYKTVEEALVAYGGPRFAGKQSAQVINRADIEKRLKTMHPKGEGEDEATYKARINKLTLEEERKAKHKPFHESFQAWLKDNALNYSDIPSAFNAYVDLRRLQGDLPEGIQKAPIFTEAQVKAYAKKNNMSEEAVRKQIEERGGTIRRGR